MIIEKTSYYITEKWKDKKIIDPELCDVYRYGIEIAISTIIGFVLIGILGVVFSCPLKSLIFLLVFVPVRNYCGGYHANTYFLCNIVISAVFIIVVLLSKYIIINYYFIIPLALFGLLVMCLFAPVENKNKPIDDKQKSKCKIVSIVLFALSIFVCTIIINISSDIANTIWFTLSAVILLMSVELIIKRRYNNEKFR